MTHHPSRFTPDAFPDPLTRSIAQGYAGGSFLMDNGDGLQWYTVRVRALVPLGDALHIPGSLKKHLNRFETAIDTDFAGVLAGCRDREETWISDELADLYLHLHRTGLAHSFETYQGGGWRAVCWDWCSAGLSSEKPCSTASRTGRKWRWCGCRSI
ncbi:leucyl/phenylalanyl-tRNA--protein transferase family protein [Deinococcus sp. KNUC1210]|uniref:leucyl/phenylalanyl-tRNA--protein transferase family protein n=1 Tax=Deinococcus sp. KNUC1210 TaxID=2917691 RepID=UPI001EEFE518|nr:leucyl/phenylalanyl-tRNA--protein transferase family protein [Deinococcus sp. KNUC1210]ULH16495.1 leucyl/phenylalanyl-tRNA--protein transferase family protein [Deinococcus sp. KNUC1210]